MGITTEDCNIYVGRGMQEVWDFDVPDELKNRVFRMNTLFLGKHITWESFEFENGVITLSARDFSLELDRNSAREFFSLANTVYFWKNGLKIEIK